MNGEAPRRRRGRRRPGRPVPGLRAGLPRGDRHRRRRRPSRAGRPTPAPGSCRRRPAGDRRRAVAVPAARPARTTRPCCARLASDGADVTRTGYGACGHPLPRPACARGRVVRPLRRARAPPVARRGGRDHARGGRSACSRPSGPVHRVLHAPTVGPRRRPGHGGRAPRRRAAGARRHLRAGCGRRGRAAGRGDASAASTLAGGGGARPAGLRRVAVAGGAWTAAVGEWFGRPLPVGPTKGQIVHLGVEGDTGEWPIAQPLLTHYLVPWPGGRVACGGTFETGAGFSVSVTAAGLQELLRECLIRRAGARGTRPTSRRASGCGPPRRDDRAAGGPAAGLGQRLGGHRSRRQRAAARAVLGAAALAHAMTEVELPSDEAPSAGVVRPRPASAERRSHAPPASAGRRETGPVLKGTLRQGGHRHARHDRERPGRAGRHGLLLARPRRRGGRRHGVRAARGPLRVPPPGRAGGRALLAAATHRRLRQLRVPRGPRRGPRAHRRGRGALLLDRPLRRHGAPGRLRGPSAHGARSASSAIPRERGGRASDRHRLPGRSSSLVDSFFPVLSDFDDRIDSLEDDILKAPTEAQLGELFDMKRASWRCARSSPPSAT